MRSTRSTGRRLRLWFGEQRTCPHLLFSLSLFSNSCSFLTSLPPSPHTSPHRSDSCLLHPLFNLPLNPALHFHGLDYMSGRTTDAQIRRSWRRKLLRVPFVAFSCHRTNCCASPARTTCPTALPRYKHTITQTYSHTHAVILLNKIVPLYVYFYRDLCTSFIPSGSSYAERRLVCVSSL